MWRESPGWSGVELAEPPTSIVRGHVFGCLFDDRTGLANRDVIGMEHILFETDYPYADGTWPRSRQVAHRICSEAGLSEAEVRALLRENAIRCLRLDRYGVSA